MMIDQQIFHLPPSVAHFVAQMRFGFGPPGSAEPSPGANTLSASFAGSVNLPSELSVGCG
jgi:hypothetical protein